MACSESLDQVKVLLSGPTNGGKTSILYKLKLGEVVPAEPTNGYNVETVEHKKVIYTIWDVGGDFQKRSDLLKYLYPSSMVFLCVVDCSSKENIQKGGRELQEGLKDGLPSNCVCVIVANKQDLSGTQSLQTVEEIMDLDSVRKTHICRVFGTSVMTGDGINKMLDWLSEVIVEKQIH